MQMTARKRRRFLKYVTWMLQQRHLNRDWLLPLLWNHRLRRHPDKLIPRRVVSWMRALA